VSQLIAQQGISSFRSLVALKRTPDWDEEFSCFCLKKKRAREAAK
jgi:hypothetical protein